MATYEKAKQYAQDAANIRQKPYMVHRKRNGQWLYGPAPAQPEHKQVELIYPIKKPA